MKNGIHELAIFGGRPAFPEALHVGRPNLAHPEIFLQHLKGILNRNILTNNGPCVQEFEERIADFIGVKHCLTVCNATAGLEILIRAMGLTGEVIVPSFTFIATAHALQWMGVTPVFCDIDPETCNLDCSRVEDQITPRTTGIVGVHLWGRSCEVEKLAEIAKRHHLHLIFDAAHAFGCSHQGQMIGNFGRAEVFSFHATKFFHTFEGGAIVTNEDTLAARIRLMRNFGFDGYDHVASEGTNAKMSEVSGAMGLASLAGMDEVIAANHRNYKAYHRGLKSVAGVSLLPYDEREKSNYQYIILRLDPGRFSLSRDQLQEVLWAENVLARRYFYPGCHRMEPYRTRASAGTGLPITDDLAERILCLPNGLSLGTKEIKQICEIIALVAAHRLEAERLPIPKGAPKPHRLAAWQSPLDS